MTPYADLTECEAAAPPTLPPYTAFRRARRLPARLMLGAAVALVMSFVIVRWGW